MNILITGCCGFIGSNLSRALIERGNHIFGVDDFSVGKKEYLHPDIDFFQRNLKSEVDLILHLASRKIPREGNPDIVLEDNVLSMIKIVEIAQKFDARVIFTSTSEIYGANEYCYEDNNISLIGSPDVSRWSYAVSKMWCEQYLNAFPDLKFNIIRLFATYGPYNSMTWRAGPIPVFINQALEQKPLTIHGDGKQKRCFQYIDDAVDGILRVIDYGIDREVYNIGNPYEKISINKLAKRTWDMINPDEKLKCAFQDPIPGVKYQEVNDRVPVIDKARENLGFEPKVELKEGLEKTIEWQRKQKGG